MCASETYAKIESKKKHSIYHSMSVNNEEHVPIPSEETLSNNNLEWTRSIDEMLARWCDQAKCFEWMHATAASRFRKRGLVLSIASSSLTAIAGVSNVIVGSSEVNGVPLSWIFGGLSVAISISNMLQEKLAYTAQATEHRAAAKQWNVIARKIEEEVILPYASRKNCSSFLKIIREDMNRNSSDVTMDIPEDIRTACLDKFSIVPNFDIPDLCGHLEHTVVYCSQQSYQQQVV